MKPSAQVTDKIPALRPFVHPDGALDLLDQLTTPVFLLSAQGIVLQLNRAACNLLAGTSQIFSGLPLCEALRFMDLDAPASLGHAIAQVDGGVSVGIDLRLAPSDPTDTVSVYRFTLRRLETEDGGPGRVLVELSDVSRDVNSIDDYARLLEAAERERSRLRELFAQTPAGIGMTSGPDHRWVFINEDFVRLTGRTSPNDFLGKTILESMPEMEAQGFPNLLDRVYRTGQSYRGHEAKARVNRAARALPEEGYFDFLYQPLRDANGKVEGIFVYATEVTAIVVARKTVEDTIERLRMAQSAAQIGVWEWDPIRDVHLLSPELHRIFGTDLTDPNHVAVWTSNVSSADWSHVQMLMNEGHRLGYMEFEYRYNHPDLGQRWLYCKGHRRPGETRMFGVVQDITIRKTAEMAAFRLAAIVESSADAIVSKDLKGIVTSWNPGAERIFGFTAAEMIGQPITKIIPPALYDDETRILSTIARGDRIEHFETVRVHKSGEYIDVSLTVSPVRDQSGRIVGAAKIARNITQQKKAERALRTSERLASVGRLAATVAHEINNPLEAVTNLIFLAKTAQDPQPYLKMAEEELQRVAQLTRQTLGFYRETKTATRIRIGELIHSLLPIFNARLRNKNLELIPEISNELEINAVPGEIRQVIANLFSNSIDALGNGGRIRLRVSAAKSGKSSSQPGVRLTIADNGSGIPATARDRIFEPFFTTKKDVGTGLGLWICKSIVENHGGTIRVHSSTRPGRRGTAFSIFLPQDSAPISTTSPEMASNFSAVGHGNDRLTDFSASS